MGWAFQWLDYGEKLALVEVNYTFPILQTMSSSRALELIQLRCYNITEMMFSRYPQDFIAFGGFTKGHCVKMQLLNRDLEHQLKIIVKERYQDCCLNQ